MKYVSHYHCVEKALCLVYVIAYNVYSLIKEVHDTLQALYYAL